MSADLDVDPANYCRACGHHVDLHGGAGGCTGRYRRGRCGCLGPEQGQSRTETISTHAGARAYPS